MNETKVAVITGAASGIGLGLAKAAADRGHKIYLVDIGETQVNSAAASIGTRAVPVVTDVTDPEAMDRLAERVFRAEGRVDYLFNNAGIIRGGPSWKIAPADWRKIIEVNLLGVAYGICSFVRRMMETKLPCHIINNSSVAGLIPAAFLGPYTASKFGVTGLTEALAIELGAEKSSISVHLLAPGAVKTSIFAGIQPESQSDSRVQSMRAYTEQTGRDPYEYGQEVFQAVDRGEFWIVTHPEILDAPLQLRTDRILKRQGPTAEQLVTDPRVKR